MVVLLLIVITVSYTVPQAKYIGTDFITGLEVPFKFHDWKGRDVSKALNIKAASTNFNFVNKALANEYINNSGQNLIFIILDAGNFHHPKVCFTGAGYKIKELTDTVFEHSGHSLTAHTLYTERGNESFLSFYWIVIDKNIAHQWIEQKIKQLFFSMLNKKRVGLMVRLDIPTKEDNIEDSLILAKQFISDLSQSLSQEDSGYILGSD